MTPAREADLRRVLEGQTSELSVRGVHRHELGEYPGIAREHRGLLVLDALDEADLRHIGALVVSSAHRPIQLAVGSGGLSFALASALPSGLGRVRVSATRSGPGEEGPVLAISGSCAGETARQVAAAERSGWEVVSLAGEGIEGSARLAGAALGAGRSVVVSSASRDAGAPDTDPGPIGEALGRVAAATVAGARPGRLLVAGGDTSGAVVRALGVEAVSYLGRVAGHGVLCALCAPGSELDGLQAVLKGGQIGGEDFFERVRLGT